MENPIETYKQFSIFENSQNQLIKSINIRLNEFMEGGLHKGQITEIYGQSGSGKTQLAMQFIIGAMSNNLTIGYLSVGKQLHINRLIEIAYEYMLQEEYQSKSKNLLYNKYSDYNSAMYFIENVFKKIRNKKKGLLIIDNICELMKNLFEKEQIERDNLMKSKRKAQFVNRIRWMAKISGSAVLLINNATDIIDKKRNSSNRIFYPTLGPSWQLLVDESIELSRKNQLKQINIVYSSKCKVGNRKKFRIAKKGFIWVEQDGEEHQ